MIENFKQIRTSIKNVSPGQKPRDFYVDYKVLQEKKWQTALRRSLRYIPKDKRPNTWKRIEIIIDIL